MASASGLFRQSLERCEPKASMRAAAAQNRSSTLVELYNRQAPERDDAMGNHIVPLIELLPMLPASARLPARLTLANLLYDLHSRWGLVADLVAARHIYRDVVVDAPADWPLRATALEHLALTLMRCDGVVERNPIHRLDAANEAVDAAREVVRLREDESGRQAADARLPLAALLRLRSFLLRHVPPRTHALPPGGRRRRHHRSARTSR